MKVENWDDLFKFNTELINDDYNQGQALVLKTKAKATDNVTVSFGPFAIMHISLESDSLGIFNQLFVDNRSSALRTSRGPPTPPQETPRPHSRASSRAPPEFTLTRSLPRMTDRFHTSSSLTSP